MELSIICLQNGNWYLDIQRNIGGVLQGLVIYYIYRNSGVVFVVNICRLLIDSIMGPAKTHFCLTKALRAGPLKPIMPRREVDIKIKRRTTWVEEFSNFNYEIELFQRMRCHPQKNSLGCLGLARYIVEYNKLYCVCTYLWGNAIKN